MGEVYIETFTSPGCANCSLVKKLLEELTNELKGDITVEEVDITAEPTRAAQYGVMSVPAVAINGILKFIGVPKREELKKAITEELEDQNP
jgi:small redox-active disulfide protein 1